MINTGLDIGKGMSKHAALGPHGPWCPGTWDQAPDSTWCSPVGQVQGAALEGSGSPRLACLRLTPLILSTQFQ